MTNSHHTSPPPSLGPTNRNAIEYCKPHSSECIRSQQNYIFGCKHNFSRCDQQTHHLELFELKWCWRLYDCIQFAVVHVSSISAFSKATHIKCRKFHTNISGLEYQSVHFSNLDLNGWCVCVFFWYSLRVFFLIFCLCSNSNIFIWLFSCW